MVSFIINGECSSVEKRLSEKLHRSVTSPLEQRTPQNIFSVDEAVLFSVFKLKEVFI
jgi:hypothetical protein